VFIGLAQTGLAQLVSDDFDRPYSDDLGPDWIERSGQPFVGDRQAVGGYQWNDNVLTHAALSFTLDGSGVTLTAATAPAGLTLLLLAARLERVPCGGFSSNPPPRILAEV